VLEIMQAYFPKEEGSAAAAARDRLRERFLSPMCLIYLHASAFICDLYSCRFVSIRGHFLLESRVAPKHSTLMPGGIAEVQRQRSAKIFRTSLIRCCRSSSTLSRFPEAAESRISGAQCEMFRRDP
jgi:hypothetical protein